ncbi:urease subunit beta [Erwinia sp. OLTSP20]|uniref:urease subunit beta n=1 Tax=unclassified Erwinia TaxID=2622719 RepID=UPI000C1871F3|nr:MULTISPECIES: urease subunit beta [unclassified Erwinia]PIJ50125.1 urease subunit beta [Erwinia sp. OAMSP11]PIJ71891.1 urease subunit beta [Erwinia sp. OLSSP12]PIJ81093.1 urease subunit beta [Erwinia sp. OLCASP19]PIJ83523.1 urease subunit beta [Erwinia sp. OLMTSP26]PIJ86138.1 urease subunit beta [Erwinia sp. OLMDSP33]
MKNQKKLAQIPPGGYLLAKTPITFNQDKTETRLKVRNTGDRPIQIGAHFHFFEANQALKFNRSASWGKRLNITATTAMRFEPGDEVEVSLIDFGGKQTIYGFNNLADGWVGYSPVAFGERAQKKCAVERAIALNYQTTE